MFEGINKFFKKIFKVESKESNSGKEAKERLHLVLMQDRANVSADFLDMMKQEIIEVIKKYIDVDENAIDVRLTNQTNDDGSNGAPALYANIPIINIKEKEPMSDNEGVDAHRGPNKSEADKEPTSDNEGVDAHGASNKTETDKEPTSDNVGDDVHGVPNKPETDKEPMSDNVGDDAHGDTNKSEEDKESMSDDSDKTEQPKE